ncbi:outer membrane beta-barrel protein [Vibrio ouci]|uniref:Outer membrane protein beta-barrel domain-containing protein n=1 Tax=Vibrio ouci TaxID=2499078 RepID=A0A4Y8WA98_9VIBR|nr:outer membrane beta-barrel protein [Vibrio ouci]TFH89495.1 hypothetical protein ELS82_21970 [Vibrio ouci]
MKKIVLSACVLLSPLVHAASTGDMLVGLEVFHGKRSLTNNISNQEVTDKLNRMSGARLQYGYYVYEDVRAYGFVQRNTTQKKQVDDKHVKYGGYQFGGGADYLFDFSPNLYGYVGGELSVMKNRVTYNLEESGKTKKTSVVFGTKAGLGYQFSDAFTIEGGVKFDHPSSSQIKLGNESLRLSHGAAVFTSLNYRF